MFPALFLLLSFVRADLSSPWQTQDVGAVGAAGSANESGGIFTVVGSGVDIQDAADEFRFVYQTMSGDCTLTARVDSVQNTNPWSKAGLMIRETLNANSINALTAVTPGSGVTFQYRPATGGSSTYNTVKGISAPYWVRLVRYGNSLTGYRSLNGSDWTVTGTATVTMTAQVYAGLAVTSHNDGSLCSAVFSNVCAAIGGLPPPASPTGLSGQAFNGQVLLSWNPVSGATSYKVKRYSGGSFITVGTSGSPGYTDTSVSPGNSYSYVVSAVTDAGESLDSAQVDVALPTPPNPPVDGALDPAVFTGPSAAPAPDIFSNRAAVFAAQGVVRVLTVEERVGEQRLNELVRVPLFFHSDECSDPDEFVIVPAEGGAPVPYQVDDIRKDGTGHIVRMHAYFFIDALQPWQQRQFLLKPGTNPGAALPALPVTVSGDKVKLEGGDIKVTFFANGTRGGAIADIEPAGGTVALPQGYIGPKVTLAGQDASLNVIRQKPVTYDDPQTIEIRDLRWASGPLFAKLTVRVGPGGAPDNAQFIYMIPKYGNYFSQVEKVFHDDVSSSETSALTGDNGVLSGQIQVGGAGSQSIVRVPVGAREPVHSVYAGFNDALVNATAGLSMLPVPYTQPAYFGIQAESGPTGPLLFLGGNALIRTTDGSSTGLKVFWQQMDYHFTPAVTDQALWHEARRGSQTLTAVVDEPWAGKDLLYDKMATLGARFDIIQNWNPSWRQKIFIAYLKGQASRVQSLLSSNSTTTSSGVTDPYDLTYSVSGYTLAADLYRPSDTNYFQKALSDATTSRDANAVVDGYNFPRVNSFAYALNMHMGTHLLGMHGGQHKNNASMLAWVTDCLGNQLIKDVYGRGQRPYAIEVAPVGQSDVLYQCVSDNYLRAIEVAGNEDLSIPPSAYGRYVDGVDVNSDLYQVAPAGQSTSKRRFGYDRAMMFRMQSSDHRWEQWIAGTVPYLALMSPKSRDATVGLTEAIYFTDWAMNYGVNWADCGPLFVALITLRDLARGHNPPPLAPLPANVTFSRSADVNTVSWSAVRGTVAGYRVYRATQAGGPWTWLNSPYRQPAGQLVAGTTYADANGTADSIYWVTAEDLNGRESDWFPGEPSPTATGAAPPPRAPAGLTATVTEAGVNLVWSPASYSAGFKIKRATVSGGPYTTIASGVSSPAYTDPWLVAGSTYYYVVSGVTGALDGSNSNEAAVVVPITHETVLPAVSVNANDATASESGPEAGTFALTRNTTIGDLTVDYTLGGTDADDSDYSVSPATGSVIIPHGRSSATVTITPVDDTVAEGNETVQLTISPNADYLVSTGPATLAIADNDGFPSMTKVHWPGVTDAAIIGEGVDPDGDGIPNLMEYALGLDPAQNSTAGTPAVSLASSRLQITFTRLKEAADIVYTVEASGDLHTWTAIWTSATAAYGGGEAASEQVTVPDTATLSDPGVTKRFLRLQVTR